MNYERIIIGSGDDAIDAAVSAALQGQRAALVRPTTPWEGATARVLRQVAERMKQSPSGSTRQWRTLIAAEIQSRQAADQVRLHRLGVDTLSGEVRFLDARTLQVGTSQVTGESIVLACGTESVPLWKAPFDGERILAVEDLPSLADLPRSLVVVGAGRTGLEHAVVLAMLGVELTVVDERSSDFELCGGLMGQALMEAHSLGIGFRLGDAVIGIDRRAAGSGVGVRLASGRTLTSDAALVCIGRRGRTSGLDLESVGVGLDERGRIWCDSHGRTWTPNITAIGDVVGFQSVESAAVSSRRAGKLRADQIDRPVQVVG